MKLLELRIHLISTDEMTGIQALERLFPSKKPKIKQVEKIEFEYERHGTLSLIANWDVAVGKVLTPSIGATRTEQDFSEHIQKTIKTDEKGKWIFIVDQLNTHKSESKRQISGIKLWNYYGFRGERKRRNFTIYEEPRGFFV